MSIDLGQTVDDFYQGKSVPSEVIKMIGTALLRSQEQRSPQQIGIELNLSSKEAEELVIRCKAWELSRASENY